jgi:phosphomannomutase
VAAESSRQPEPLRTGSRDLIATHSGLRGRPGVELTDDVVEQVVGGFVEMLRLRGQPSTIGAARDERDHSGTLVQRVIDAACAAGADVVDFGVASTPAAKLAAGKRALGGVVIVTGSHLPAEWNGLKLAAAPSYQPVDVREVPAPRRKAVPSGRARSDHRAAEEHAAALCDAFDATRIRDARLGVECSGGAGDSADLVLDRLGCRGSRLSARFLLDPDSDRLQLADESGRPFDSEATLALAALALAPRTVVKGADTSRIVDLLLEPLGGRVITVPTGELHLLRAIARHRADLAGEGNGGVVVPRVGLARDGLAAGVAVLELMARTGSSLSELVAGLPQLAIRRSTLPCAGPEAAAAALAASASELDAEPPVDPLLGIKLERAPGAWALARLSATEPVIRITAEARTGAEAEQLHDEIRMALVAP